MAETRRVSVHLRILINTYRADLHSAQEAYVLGSVRRAIEGVWPRALRAEFWTWESLDARQFEQALLSRVSAAYVSSPGIQDRAGSQKPVSLQVFEVAEPLALTAMAALTSREFGIADRLAAIMTSREVDNAPASRVRELKELFRGLTPPTICVFGADRLAVRRRVRSRLDFEQAAHWDENVAILYSQMPIPDKLGGRSIAEPKISRVDSTDIGPGTVRGFMFLSGRGVLGKSEASPLLGKLLVGYGIVPKTDVDNHGSFEKLEQSSREKSAQVTAEIVGAYATWLREWDSHFSPEVRASSERMFDIDLLDTSGARPAWEAVQRLLDDFQHRIAISTPLVIRGPPSMLKSAEGGVKKRLSKEELSEKYQRDPQYFIELLRNTHFPDAVRRLSAAGHDGLPRRELGSDHLTRWLDHYEAWGVFSRRMGPDGIERYTLGFRTIEFQVTIRNP